MLLYVCLTFLFVVLDIVTCQGEGQCLWTTFPDVPSRVVVADVVFRGRLFPAIADAKVKDLWKVTVDEVFKGELKNSEKVIQLVVGSELDACRKVEMEIGQSYLVFLKSLKMDGSDEVTSIYIASSPPEALTDRKVREAKKYGCRQCGRYPKARLSLKQTFWNLGERIKMTCQLDGLPAPRVTWYKNNMAVNASSRIQIIRRKSSSELVISEADDLDGGTYSCVAENVLGSASSEQSHAVIETGMLALNDESHPNAKPCEQQTYCVNGGVCYEMENLGTKYCVCPAGYTGHRCQDKGPEIGIGGMEDILVIVCIFLMVLLLMTTFAILFCIAKFRHDVSQHISRYFAIVEGISGKNGGLQSLSEQKNRRSPELMESQQLLFPGEDHPLSQPKTSPTATEAAPIDKTTARASSPSSSYLPAAAAAFGASCLLPSETNVFVPTRPSFDSGVEKMTELGWGPKRRVPASGLKLSPKGDNGKAPDPSVQKNMGLLGADSWTCPEMGDRATSLANCSSCPQLEAARDASFFDSKALAGRSAVDGGAVKGLAAGSERSDKKLPADYDYDVNALLIELGVYESEAGNFSLIGD